MIKGSGGTFAVEVEPGLPTYAAKEVNGVGSQTHAGTQFSVTFIKTQTDSFEPFTGMMVDYDVSKPQEGMLTDVKKTDTKGFWKIRIKLENGSNEIDTEWPDDNVKFCGRLIPKRECDKESRDPAEGSMKKTNFCFGLLDECDPGYFVYEGISKIKERLGRKKASLNSVGPKRMKIYSVKTKKR